MKRPLIATLASGLLVVSAALATAAGGGAAAAAAKLAKLQVAWLKTDMKGVAPGSDGEWLAFGAVGHDMVGAYSAQASSKVDGLKVMTATDGASAWMTFTTTTYEPESNDGGPGPPVKYNKVQTRFSEILVNTPSGWQVMFGHLSYAQPDAVAHEVVKMGGGNDVPLAAKDAFPAELAPVVEAWKAGKLETVISDRKDVMGFGSAPGEVAKGAASVRKGWKTWGTTATVHGGVVGALTPSGNNGWLAAALTVHKTAGKESYDIPFNVTLFVEKTDAGWRVVNEQVEVR